MASKIVFFGDSITWGEGLACRERERWSALVAARNGLLEINEGKPGRPASAVDEFHSVVEAYRADPEIGWLFLALGANDARDEAPDCVPKTVAHIAGMIGQARARVPKWKIVLCSPYNIDKARLQRQEIAGTRERNLREMRGAYRLLAEATGVLFIDLWGAIPFGSLDADGVHPDAKGHAAVARAVESTSPLLGERGPGAAS